MKQIINWFQSIRLRQMLMVLVAGFLLFFTQACAGGGDRANAVQPRQASQSGVRPNSEVYVPKGDNVLNRYEGGMNNFSDVDPRSQGSSQAKARAEYLKENASQQKAQLQTNNPAEAASRVGSDRGYLGRNVGQKAEDVTQKAQGTAEDFAQGTRKGLENIKRNTQNAGDYLQEAGEKTTGNNPIEGVKQSARDAANAVNRTFND